MEKIIIACTLNLTYPRTNSSSNRSNQKEKNQLIFFFKIIQPISYLQYLSSEHQTIKVLYALIELFLHLLVVLVRLGWR